MIKGKAAVLLAGAVIISAALCGCAAKTNTENSELTSSNITEASRSSESSDSSEVQTEPIVSKESEWDGVLRLGDVDENGAIDSQDALLVLRSSTGLTELNARRRLLGDVDEDGQAMSSDALEILRYSVGLSTSSQVGKPFEEKEESSETDSTSEKGTDTSKPEPDSDYAADSENETDSDTSTPPSDFDGYVVTIDRCDGTLPEKDTYEKGEGIRLPFREPEQAGYYFDGWYEDLNDLEPVYDGTVYDRDVTIYARWTDKNFYLGADDDYVYVKDTDKGEPVRITLSTTLDFENGIEVLYGEKDDLSNSVTLLDNASRENGDDIKGDGVYSGYAYLKNGDSEYYMVASHDGEKSNVLHINTLVYYPEGVDSPIDTVSKSLIQFKYSQEYQAMTREERKNAILDILYDFVDQGIIESKDKIWVDEYHPIVIYEAGKITRFIEYDDMYLYDTNFKNNTSNDYKIRKSGTLLSSSDESNNTNNLFLNSLYFFNNTAYNESEMNLRINEFSEAVGGNVEVIDNPTIEDFLNLDKYKSVYIFSHGYSKNFKDPITKKEDYYPCISLPISSLPNDENYISELEGTHQILLGTEFFWLTHAFFKTNYGKYDLINTEIYNSCCEGLGKGKGGYPEEYNYCLANAFIENGAKLYIGMLNDVYSDYSAGIINSFITDQRENPDNLYYESFCRAIDENGWNDGRTALKEYPDYAYPVLVTPKYIAALDLSESNDTVTLRDYDKPKETIDPSFIEDDKKEEGIVNGSFEIVYKSSIKGWDADGDVRIFSEMGDAEIDDGAGFCFLSTGISSTKSDVEFGKISSISQNITVPKDANKLVFSYNLISEEAMEYIGYTWGPHHSLTYNDEFRIQINKSHVGYIEAPENISRSAEDEDMGEEWTARGDVLFEDCVADVYSAKWYNINGVDFVDGDDTIYQTKTLRYEADVSELQGKTVVLNLALFDIGDLDYHTGCMVDHIRFE